MRELWHDLGIGPVGAIAVVISSAVVYAVFVLILHTLGDRLRGASSSVTIAMSTLIGAIAARSTLGNHPTLAGGLIALATLLVMERLFGGLLGAVRRSRERRR